MSKPAASFTPGPWESSNPHAVFSTAAFHFGNRYMVASVYGDHPECKADDVMAANARLIAAAPCLLAALKALFAVASHKHPLACLIVGIEEQHAAAIAAARAAIAKAEGVKS
jgi:deoxyxylulose-5-phosphate synthase